MNPLHPISAVVPGAYGAVLSVLARTDRPLSGRQIAELTNPQVSQRGTNDVLGRLVADGIAVRESSPPAYRYVLNREHLAAQAIESLASLTETLFERLRAELVTWSAQPVAAWLYGSVAAGSADRRSDIDILVVRPALEPVGWHEQLLSLADLVKRWTGNECEVLDLDTAQLSDAVQRDDRLVRDLRAHGLALAGADPAGLIAKARPTAHV